VKDKRFCEDIQDTKADVLEVTFPQTDVLRQAYPHSCHLGNKNEDFKEFHRIYVCAS
jgi:hypothetical protein